MACALTRRTLAGTVFAVLAGLQWPHPAAAGSPDAGPLTVRVYDAAGISETDVADATATAQRILAAAGVATEWVACGRQPEHCARPLGPAEVTVRLVAVSMPDHYRGSLPMGDAMVDTAARGGSLATIYANRVAWLARAGQSDARVLLGRAIAHEIGHLLLGTTGHAAHGLMRARWLEHEVRRPVAVDWLFTSGDARRMQEKLARLATGLPRLSDPVDTGIPSPRRSSDRSQAPS